MFPGVKNRGRTANTIGLDFGASALKAVVLKAGRDGPVVVQTALLPALPPGERPELPKSMKSGYLGLALSGQESVVRYVTLPGFYNDGEVPVSKVKEHMGIEDGYRLAHAFIASEGGRKKGETRLLAAAMPEDRARLAIAPFEKGLPAPAGLEVAGLSAVNGFQMYRRFDENEDLAFVEGGAAVTILTVFRGGRLALARKFSFGGGNLEQAICREMGLDEEVARGLLADRSFDISQAAEPVLGPLLKQLSISKDFVERRDGGRLTKCVLSGGMALSPYWCGSIEQALGVPCETWNPFESLETADSAIAEDVAAAGPRMAAAAGAALGVYAAL